MNISPIVFSNEDNEFINSKKKSDGFNHKSWEDRDLDFL